MVKERVLIWGKGHTLKQNICWIRQIYDIVGITDSDTGGGASEIQELEYDIILVVSIYYQEIEKMLVESYNADKRKIRFFEDEFEHERKFSFGTENENVTFYVMRGHWKERKNGLFNFYARALTTYYHTKEKGYELLIDLKNYYTEYAGEERYGEANIWEDYFQQPSEYSLSDAYKSRNVILSKFADEAYNDLAISEYPHCSKDWYQDTYRKLGIMYHDQVVLNVKMQEALENEKRTLRKSRILGVLARGTDMSRLKPENHFIPYETEKFICHVKKYMERSGYEYIYLATEDAGILEQFQKAFGAKVLVTEQLRMSDTGNRVLMDISFDRENDGYLRGKEYCLVIAMLSCCSELLANCLCGGVLGALTMNGGRYAGIEIMDSGKYK